MYQQDQQYVSGVVRLQVSLKLTDCNMMPTEWFRNCLVGSDITILISIYSQYEHNWYVEEACSLDDTNRGASANLQSTKRHVPYANKRLA
jgi:hypothetical protein